MINISQYPSKSWRQHGLTLVEIMVALVISLFLIAGIIELFIGTKQLYRFHDGLSRLQENGRFALDRMTRDIRVAGYLPVCSPPCPEPALTPVQGDGSQVTVQWSNNTGTAVLSSRYSIAMGVGGRNALFLQSDGGTNQELVEGVEAMQVSYGACAQQCNVRPKPALYTNSVNPPYTLTSASVNGICSVRIDLLLLSLEPNLTTEPQTVTFPPPPGVPVTFTVPERRIPQIFSTTVAVRNCLP